MNWILPSLGKRKTALFCLIPDNDTSFNFLVSLLYTQIFQQLFDLADNQYGGALPIPVHFLMDEFANVSLPDDFDKILATMRSRNVFVSIILQNISQLKALFEKQWESILGNCDESLYLAEMSKAPTNMCRSFWERPPLTPTPMADPVAATAATAPTTSWQAGELMTPNEVQQMDNRKALLFIRGERPVMDEKYDIRKHPYVALTPDGGGSLYIHGDMESSAATMERLDGQAGAESLWAYLPEDMDCELLTNEEIEALFTH